MAEVDVPAARSASGGESGSPMDRGGTSTAAAGGRVNTADPSADAVVFEVPIGVEGPSSPAGSGKFGFAAAFSLGGVAAMLLPESERTSPPPTMPAPDARAPLPPPYLEHEGKCRSRCAPRNISNCCCRCTSCVMFRNLRCAEMDVLLRLAAMWYALLPPPLPPALTLLPSSKWKICV